MDGFRDPWVTKFPMSNKNLVEAEQDSTDRERARFDLPPDPGDDKLKTLSRALPDLDGSRYGAKGNGKRNSGINQGQNCRGYHGRAGWGRPRGSRGVHDASAGAPQSRERHAGVRDAQYARGYVVRRQLAPAVHCGKPAGRLRYRGHGGALSALAERGVLDAAWKGVRRGTGDQDRARTNRAGSASTGGRLRGRAGERKRIAHADSSRGAAIRGRPGGGAPHARPRVFVHHAPPSIA